MEIIFFSFVSGTFSIIPVLRFKSKHEWIRKSFGSKVTCSSSKCFTDKIGIPIFLQGFPQPRRGLIPPSLVPTLLISHRYLYHTGYRYQCCGSEFILFGFGSTILFSDSVSDSYPYTDIVTRHFFKWCLSMLSCVFWSVRQRKIFPTEKRTFFSLSSVWSAIYITTVAGSESKSKYELFSDSESDPAKIFGFFRIRIHNTDGYRIYVPTYNTVPGIKRNYASYILLCLIFACRTSLWSAPWTDLSPSWWPTSRSCCES
jgi:hypothetical protein